MVIGYFYLLVTFLIVPISGFEYHILGKIMAQSPTYFYIPRQDREKRGRVDQDAAKRLVTSGLWKPGEEKIRYVNVGTWWDP